MTRRRRCQRLRSRCVDDLPRSLTVQDDLWTWHFTIRVPHPGFEGGIYHGRINVREAQLGSRSRRQLPNEYPLRPPGSSHGCESS